MMSKTTLAYGTIGALAIAAGVLFGVHANTPAAATPAAVTQLMAETLPDAHGTAQALKQWQGKLLVVNFWATWCAPCVKEMPELSALQAELGSKAQILGIGIDNAANIAEFSKQHHIAYPLYVAGMGGAKLTRSFGNQLGGLPFTVLIEADGRIRKTYIGALDMAELRKDLAQK